ncbi:hypothetical protein BH09PSE4_BH09PSE4_00010 [soil metagenome]
MSAGAHLGHSTTLANHPLTLGCRCRACHAMRIRIHDHLSPPQRRAIAVLDFAVPRPPIDLARRDDVRFHTLFTLLFARDERPPLVRPIDMRLGTNRNAPSVLFYCLTQHGAEILAAAAKAQRKAA